MCNAVICCKKLEIVFFISIALLLMNNGYCSAINKEYNRYYQVNVPTITTNENMNFTKNGNEDHKEHFIRSGATTENDVEVEVLKETSLKRENLDAVIKSKDNLTHNSQDNIQNQNNQIPKNDSHLTVEGLTTSGTEIDKITTTITETSKTQAPTTIVSPIDISSTETPSTGIPTTTHQTPTTVAPKQTTTVNIPIHEDRALCPSLNENLDHLTQNQFSSILTSDCRYDKLTKPPTENPMEVILQIDIRHIEAMEQLQFKMHILLQYRYNDSRLNYKEISPKRGPMLGENVLRSRIWIPHLILANERDTSIMGLEGKDVFVSISPLGEIIYSYRMTAMIYCWMDLRYFPFDEQICSMNFTSWTYNASSIRLKWDGDDAAKVASQLHLTEFRFEGGSTKEDLLPAPLPNGAFSGNYSALIYEFKVKREVGYYVMDYFLPSIMLVCTSWVTFWLQADNAAPRVTLGTSTMLSFITLASGQSKTLPKVSYIKVSEIWFLACSLFIFASMVEFAFVNIIWRRRKKVELKKVNSKYILKSTLTPRLARKELQRTASGTLYKARSCGSLNGVSSTKEPDSDSNFNNYLTVHTFRNIPIITTQSEDDLIVKKNASDTSINIPEAQNENQPTSLANRWTTMTPQEVAIWIDRRSRLVFPLAFLIFNVIFWVVVVCV